MLFYLTSALIIAGIAGILIYKYYCKDKKCVKHKNTVGIDNSDVNDIVKFYGQTNRKIDKYLSIKETGTESKNLLAVVSYELIENLDLLKKHYEYSTHLTLGDVRKMKNGYTFILEHNMTYSDSSDASFGIPFLVQNSKYKEKMCRFDGKIYIGVVKFGDVLIYDKINGTAIELYTDMIRSNFYKNVIHDVFYIKKLF